MPRRPVLFNIEEVVKSFQGEDAIRFPPLMNLGQLAELVGRSKKTIYHWKAQGRLDTVLRKRGKHCYVWRDLFLNLFLNGKDW